MRPRHLRTRALPSLLAGLALLALPAAASGHAALLGADPAPGQRLQDPPREVTLRFSEPLNARLSRATLVLVDGGERVPTTVAASGRRLVLRPATALGRGAYRVEWHSVSTDDAHPLEGRLGFGIGVPAAGGAEATESSPLARDGWLRVPARAALYAALLLFSGALLCSALLGGTRWLIPPASGPEARELDVAGQPARVEGILVDVGIFTAGLAAGVAGLEAASAAGRLSGGALGDYLLSGLAGFARVGVIVFVIAAVALLRRRPRAAALAAAAALGCVVASGHANSADPRALAVPADFVHLVAGAVWLGGSAMIVITWGAALRRDGAPARRAVARHVLPAFGRVALPAFIAVVVTGTISAVVELGRVSALWDTSYGLVLSAKIALVAAIAAVSYVHALRLRPRLLAANPHPPARVERSHWRLVRTEPLLALAVVAAAGLLVAFPLPPRQLDAAGSAAGVPACDPCPLPAPARGELAVAGQGGSRVVAAWLRSRGEALAGTIRQLDFRGKPAAGPVTVNGLATRACGRGCASFRVPASPALRVVVRDRGRPYPVTLPARWRTGQSRRARALLERAQAAMRALPSVREHETVTSGPGTLAVTRYRLRAPDRLAFATARGVESIFIGRRRWLRSAGEPFREQPVTGIPFRTRSWFRWTPYARAVEVLDERREGARAVTELALMEPGTPVWIRLVVDRRSGRVVRESLVAPARFITHRFFAFGAPVAITPPREVER